ncbi:protein RGF1 INDUCIBLE TRANSCRIPTION FACTOR 1 [Elaeis guineensis]|uniref:Uncharacterized protein LOC105048477 n=1 Tax=Elaeis guineensis var. tenera TaxID=51953 RepID=A0A6I9RGB2_ELAGV|nr:uncharacterized protein LOC105048477 [Elaeis guineensis]
MVGYAFHYKINLEKERKSRERRKPSWLEPLLNTKFFGLCDAHKDLRKSEENTYCIDCNRCMCPHCLAFSSVHRGHRLLQIRRYVYQDVIRITDMQKLIDCSKVQPYTVNSAKVLLLNPRKNCKATRMHPGGANCRICGWALTEPNRYCSLACKVSKVAPSVGADDGSTGSTQTESLFDHLMTDIEAYGLSSDSSEGSRGRCTDALSPKAIIHRRKGNPRRAPMN